MVDADSPPVPEPEIEDAFDRLVDEGEVRLARPVLALLSTGLLGGIDIGAGVLAYLLVDASTHNTLLAGMAFSIGFIALLLARSELFTENFLVPVLTVVAGKAGFVSLTRLWAITLGANLAGGWVISWLIIPAGSSSGRGRTPRRGRSRAAPTTPPWGSRCGPSRWQCWPAQSSP